MSSAIQIFKKTVRASSGTQSNELAAKIKSVTSSTTIGAVFVYDTRNDSDSGAWRKKARGSWYYETLNTATRGGRREFPSVAIIVADNATVGSVYGTVTIYDGDDPSLPMWRVYNNLVNNSMTGIYALNGRVYVSAITTTQGGGLYHLDFVNDFSARQTDDAGKNAWNHYVQLANSTYQTTPNFWGGPLVNISVNDVAATVLEGAEIGALGLPIPTVAVATDGGVSVIHPNGSVYDLSSTSHTNNDVRKVFFTDDGMVGYNFEASGSHDRAWAIGMRKIPFADENIQSWDNAVNLERYMVKVGGAVTGLTTNTDEYSSSDSAVNAVIPTGKNGLAIGYGDRLSIVKRNTGHMEEGAVAFVTSDYNSGYQLGDIRFAGLANHWHNDRSVKGNHLTENGSISNADVATDAELKAYSGFSASNYLSRAADTDFDFGTGDFSIMFWAKFTSNDSGQCMIDRSASGTPRILIYNTGGNVLQFYIHDGSGGSSVNAGSFGDNNWHQVVCVKRGTSSISIFVDGVLKGETTSIVSGTLSSATAPLHIGVNNAQNDPLNGSLSLVRLSATVPTPTQVKEMYEAEAPLFRAGAKCLLQSDDASPNAVNDLSYDASTDLLHVFQNGDTVGENLFRGLEVVESRGRKSDGWTYSSASYGVAAGGVSASARALSGGGVIVDIPPFDVRGDTNIADSKLPDDGKIHFTGVTTDATQTTIGTIFIDENETYTVRAKVTGHRYSEISSDRVFTEIEQTFYRKTGADVQEPAAHRKIEDLVVSTTDVSLVRSTGNNTINLKVTGVAGQRLEWNATVEVQRITERSYER